MGGSGGGLEQIFDLPALPWEVSQWVRQGLILDLTEERNVSQGQWDLGNGKVRAPLWPLDIYHMLQDS